MCMHFLVSPIKLGEIATCCMMLFSFKELQQVLHNSLFVYNQSLIYRSGQYKVDNSVKTNRHYLNKY